MQRLLIVCAALLIGACNQKQAVTQAQNFLSECPGFVETGKAPLVFRAECGTLMVKENPADPASRDIGLAVLRLPAVSPVAQADPLFLIQGGPGGSSIEMASFLHSQFADVRKNRDLIFVDQRGTGKSNPLKCEPPDKDLELQDEALQRQENVARMQRCAETFRTQIPFYTTNYAVQDLDQVRTALGYQQINLWGGSYGTRVALEYARRYPAHARTMILDGVAPVAIALPRYFARDTQAALRAVNAECAALPECFASFGDIVETAQQVQARLAQAQADGTPLVVTAPHPRHQQPETLQLTPNSFAQLIFMSLYSRDLTVLLPRAISEAAQENYRLLVALAALAAEQGEQMNIAEGMHFSVVCNEDWHFNRSATDGTDQRFLGRDFVADMAPICEFWPRAQLPEDYWEPIVSEVPALLLSGGRDPVTPHRWADAVAAYLSNAVALEAVGGNHGVSMEGCVPQVIAQFIAQANLADTNTECVQKIKPLPLVLGANQKKSASAASISAQASSSRAPEGSIQP